MPLPCRSQNSRQVRLPRRPPENSLGHGRIRDQLTGIAGSLLFDSKADWPFGYLLRGLNHFQNRVSSCAAQVKELRISTSPEMLERQRMRIRKIAHVNIIADGRPIGCPIGVAKDRNLRKLSRCCPDDVRNKVCFRIVILSKALCGSGCVEITESHEFQPIRYIIRAEYLLQD